RDAAREIRGAVDRVDDPDIVAEHAAGFLAEEGVARKMLGERVADKLFDLAVGFGQVILWPLERVRPAFRPIAERVERECTGFAGDGGDAKEALLDLSRH